MQWQFEMLLMGELTYFLWFKIKQGKERNLISKTKYCIDILKKFEMKYWKTISTPTASNMLIDNEERGMDFDITRCRVMIRSLLYLTASRYDIMFSVCMCEDIKHHLMIPILRSLNVFWGILMEPPIIVFGIRKEVLVA